ncbi:MAG: SGNH/GDSL hydrolase family protein [Lentisphaeraceae bacterium]|nr:SGNH/GDSL hydrolase family protein [Lentisphaeraceae bacterium]
MLYKLLTFFILLLSVSTQSAEKFTPKDKDVIVLSGDSITHQCMYTQYIENFLYTRYHDKKLHLFNSGISGDKAIDLLNRFEEDLAFQKPKWVTILLGMNDGRYKNFEQENFDTYKQDMIEIVERIKGLGAVPVLMTPTMFDQQQYRIRGKDKNFRFNRLNTHPDYNAKLGLYSGWLRSTANDMDLNLVDFWGPMNDITAFFRQTDKNFTLSPDSIHPDPNGQAIMAVQMAKYFANERGAVHHSFDAKGLNAFTTEVKPQYLPWVLPATNKPGPKPYLYPDNPMPGFKKALEDSQLNDEILTVSNLKMGNYDVLMNGETVLSNVSNSDLAKGVELQFNEKSPTFKQALEVATLNEKRNTEGLRHYRGKQGSMKGARRKFADKPDELAKFRAKIQPELDKYLKIADDYEKKIHELAVPKSFTLEVRPDQ